MYSEYNMRNIFFLVVFTQLPVLKFIFQSNLFESKKRERFGDVSKGPKLHTSIPGLCVASLLPVCTSFLLSAPKLQYSYF